MSGSITFTVPGVPQGKGRPRVGTISGRARVFTPAKTVAYENLIAHAAQQAMAGRPLIDGPVSCAIAIDAPIPASWSKRKQAAALAGELMPTTKPDADNVVKAIFDGLNNVLWRDDVQVVDLSVRKRYAATPGVRVTIAAGAGSGARCCPQCDDGDGNCAFPYYGVAPHTHEATATAPELMWIGSTRLLPREQWPANFRPDEESDECGTYTHCLHCGAA